MISFCRHFIFLLAAMLTPLAVGAEAITVDGAYARASSKLAKSAAAFMEIKNMSSTEDRLIGARSDFAKRVELHTHIKSEDGVMKMRRVDGGLLIAGNGNLMLQRGGDHIMFMGLSKPIADGDTIQLKLIFENAGAFEIEIPVYLKELAVSGSGSLTHTHFHTHKNSTKHKHTHTHLD